MTVYSQESRETRTQSQCIGEDAGQTTNHSILLVEDNVDFALLLQEALAELQSETSLAVVRNGTELGHFLGGAGDHAGQPLPDIILLDLTLPGKDGFEILQDRKLNPDFSAIPVIVFTGSTNPADVDRSYALGANSFVSRPAGFEELIHVVRALEEFWLEIVSLPRTSE